MNLKNKTAIIDVKYVFDAFLDFKNSCFIFCFCVKKIGISSEFIYISKMKFLNMKFHNQFRKKNKLKQLAQAIKLNFD